MRYSIAIEGTNVVAVVTSKAKAAAMCAALLEAGNGFTVTVAAKSPGK